MPGTINYTGDQAAVLPDNTAALVHFSDQFAQMQRQKELDQRLAQKQDLQRQKDITTYIGNRLNHKDFVANSTYQGLIDNGLSNTHDTAVKMMQAGASLPQVADYVDNAVLDLSKKTNNIKALDQNIAADAAALAKKYPDLDQTALISLARHDISYDQNGNLIDPGEIDPNQHIVAETFKKHYGDLFPAGTGDADLAARLDKKKLADVKVPSQFDEKGNITQTGWTSKLPDFATVIKDANGKPLVQAQSKNYRFPGAKTDYVDNNGQNVKVAPERLFNEYYNGALGANIERQVRETLKTPIQTDKGPVVLSPDSEYANMLRRKLLYEKLNDATSRYPVNMDANAAKESFNRKNALLGRSIQEANLKIREHSSERADERLQMAKDKEANKSGSEVPLMDQYEQSKAQTFLDGSKYINVNDIKPEDLKKITGNKYLADGSADPAHITKNVEPFSSPDGSKYYLIKDGEWYGEGGMPIDKSAAYKRQTEPLSKAEKKVGFVKKTVNYVKNKIKGTDKPLYDFNSN